MVVWTDNAISHITEFIDEVREGTEETAKNYMRKLVDYTDDLLNKVADPRSSYTMSLIIVLLLPILHQELILVGDVVILH